MTERRKRLPGAELLRIARKVAVPSEHVEQSFLFQRLELLTGKYPELQWAYAIPNAGGFKGGFASNVGMVNKLRAEGVKSGVPDICIPVARYPFHGLYVEMKRLDTYAEPEQRRWQAGLIAQGYAAVTCQGHEAALAVIEAYLKLERWAVPWPAVTQNLLGLTAGVEGVHVYPQAGE